MKTNCKRKLNLCQLSVICHILSVGSFFLLCRRPGHEGAGAFDIIAVAGTIFYQRLFGQGDPGHFQKYRRDNNGAYDGPPAVGRRQRNEKNSPPDEKFSEIVQVTGIGPQSAVHAPTLTGRIRFKLRQLPVPQGLECKTHQPNDSTKAIEPGKSFRCRCQLTDLDDKRYHPQK